MSKTGYREAYEENSVETLETVVLQSFSGALNPDRSARISFYRELIEEKGQDRNYDFRV